MKLTEEQQLLLDGSRGEVMAKIVKTLVMYGDAFGAEIDYERIQMFEILAHRLVDGDEVGSEVGAFCQRHGAVLCAEAFPLHGSASGGACRGG